MMQHLAECSDPLQVPHDYFFIASRAKYNRHAENDSAWLGFIRQGPVCISEHLLTRGTSGLYFRVLDFKLPPSQLLIG